MKKEHNEMKKELNEMKKELKELKRKNVDLLLENEKLKQYGKEKDTQMKKMAEKILSFRNKNGGFHSIDELYEIPGLTDKTIKRFIDRVEVR